MRYDPEHKKPKTRDRMCGTPPRSSAAEGLNGPGVASVMKASV